LQLSFYEGDTKKPPGVEICSKKSSTAGVPVCEVEATRRGMIHVIILH